MAAHKENSIFPSSPYHIPGYEGFIPQYSNCFGETFGKTTHRLLTDPEVVRSPRPLLAPLHKLKFIEDFSGAKPDVQGHLPGRPGYFPYEKPVNVPSVPGLTLGPKPPQLGPSPAEEELLLMLHRDPASEDHPGEYIPRPRLPQGYPLGNSWEGRVPGTTLAWGQGQSRGIGQLSPALAGSKVAVRTGGVTLPRGVEARDGQEDEQILQLEVPQRIQQKVISGYAGFIPRLTWIHGVNYLQSVKEAMREFDHYQFLQRNPPSSFGRRYPKTYWPDHRIYTSAGLIPFYTGFVPELRHIYALTFGNSTRKAHQKEKRRRARAL
ncbi:ciliary microtubule inner protein 2A [Phaethornis superciliosus]